jgi:hypothetical protein
MSLRAGKLLHCQYWTEVPVPAEVIDQMNQYGMRDKMPKSLNFGNGIGVEYPEYHNDDNDNHDTVYSLDEDDQSSHALSESHSCEDSDPSNDQPDNLQSIDITGVGYEKVGNKDNSDDKV